MENSEKLIDKKAVAAQKKAKNKNETA